MIQIKYQLYKLRLVLTSVLIHKFLTFLFNQESTYEHKEFNKDMQPFELGSNK
jgi:hypothetical protein